MRIQSSTDVDPMAPPLAVALATGGRWQSSRFDPRTGKSQRLDVPLADGRATLVTPDEQDWVFLLRSETAAATAH